MKHWSPFDADLRIDLIIQQYNVMVVPCRDNFIKIEGSNIYPQIQNALIEYLYLIFCMIDL